MTAYIIAPCIAHSRGRNTDACTILVLIRKSRIFFFPFYVFWNNFSTRDHSDSCMWSHQQRNVFWLISKTNDFYHDKARYTYRLVRRLSYPDLTPNKNIYPSVEYIELLLYGNIFHYQWVLTEGYHGFMDIIKYRASSKYVPSPSLSQADTLNISPRSSLSTQSSQKLVRSSHPLNSVSHHHFKSCTQRTVVSLPDHDRFQSWYRPNGFCEIFILIWVWRNIFWDRRTIALRLIGRSHEASYARDLGETITSLWNLMGAFTAMLPTRLQSNSDRRSCSAIWTHKSRSILAQMMACCLTATSHYIH